MARREEAEIKQGGMLTKSEEYVREIRAANILEQTVCSRMAKMDQGQL